MINSTFYIHNFIQYNGVKWGWDIFHNILLKMNDSYEADVARINCYEKRRCFGSLYGKVIKYQDKLIGVPMQADDILVYDLNLNVDRYIPMPSGVFLESNAGRGKFWDALIDGKHAYFIGYWSKKILKFDLDREEIVKILDIVIIESKVNDIYFKGAGIYRNNIVIPSSKDSKVYIVDKDSMEYRVELFDEFNDGFSNIFVDGEYAWMSPRRSSKFVRWNMVTNHKEYTCDFEDKLNEKPSYGFMIKYKGSILAFPLHAKCVLSINVNTLETSVERELSEILSSENSIQKTGFVEIEDNILALYRWDNNTIIHYNLDTRSKEYATIDFSNTYCRIELGKILDLNGYLNEQDFSLQMFINSYT